MQHLTVEELQALERAGANLDISARRLSAEQLQDIADADDQKGANEPDPRCVSRPRNADQLLKIAEAGRGLVTFSDCAAQ